VFAGSLRRAGNLLALLTIVLLMGNAHCYMRCSLGSLDGTHCHPPGKNANPACGFQHVISERVAHQAPTLDGGPSLMASDAAPDGAGWAIEVANHYFPPPGTAVPVLSLRI
jgi:hypothetical protein